MLEAVFASPGLLWTALAIPAVLALLLYAHVRRTQLTARLGNPANLRKTLLIRPQMRQWKAILVVLALALTALAAAGPRWGRDEKARFRKGRDLIILLDLSRSMNAEQPSRRELAVRSLRHVADSLEAHGGNRVALVAFAARPRLLFPLTQDCDHLRHVLANIEADDYPSLQDKKAASGTRIGAALRLAMDSLQPDLAHRPVFVLVSDGDDPADDDEWLKGVEAVAEKGIRIHVVGVGSSDRAETIPVGGDVLQFDGEIVRTRMNESRLREIARRTDGVYLPAPRELGVYLLQLLDAEELRDDSAGATLAVQKLRHAWFLLPAVVLMMASLLLNEGIPRSRRPRTPARVRRKAPALMVILAAMATISAADSPAVEAHLRQGDEAFASEDYELALTHYEKAEGYTTDPGRLAFNQAAAYYRLGRYREAIESYRRCLQDDQAPPPRRARACFDLGNALLQQADGDRSQLTDAVAAYRAALHFAEADATWLGNARHNLELAQLLWLKAKESPPPPKVIPNEKSKTPQNKLDGKDKKENGTVLVPVDPSKGFQTEKSKDLPQAKSSQTLQSGGIPQHLPDKDQVVPLSPENTWATLSGEADRIARERRMQRNPTGTANPATKDW